jgi:hypothetical protein
VSYTDVQICNLALSHLGDVATVASISAPTTQQERWCATFYPMARDVTSKSTRGLFGTVRKALVTSTVTPPSTWLYAYDLPTGLLDLLAVLDPNAVDDYTTGTGFNTVGVRTAAHRRTWASPPPTLRHRVRRGHGCHRHLHQRRKRGGALHHQAVTATTLFSALFVEALAFQLASYLAGPLLKGDVGAKVSLQMQNWRTRKRWTPLPPTPASAR